MTLPGEQEAQAFTQEALALRGQIKSITIQNEDQYKQTSDFLVSLNNQYKKIEDRRTAITKPMNEAKRQVDMLFKPALNALEEIVTDVKRSMSVYLKEAQAARERAMLEAARLAQSAPVTGTTPEAKEFQALVAQASAGNPEANGNVYTKARFVFVIENPALVPDEFWMIDEKKIAQFVGERGMLANIPGVKVSQETQIIARRS